MNQPPAKPLELHLPRVLSLILAGLFLPALAVLAQSSGAASGAEATARDGADELYGEEIVVTARKRQENVQKIPISVTAFPETAIEELSLADLSDIGDFTPNLSFSYSGGFGDQSSESTVFIRGIGQIDTAIFSDPAVGIYVDGIYMARAQGGVFDLLDLERIEVLRGPQGTLFGKNTTGGAISLISRKPTPDFAARLGLTLGRFDRQDLAASVGGALGSKVSALLALQAGNRDGFSRSFLSDQLFNDENRDSGRLALRFQPSPRTTVDLTGDRTRDREAGANQLLLHIVHTPLIDFHNRSLEAAGLVPYDERWISPSLRDTFADLPSSYDGDVGGTALNLTWAAPSLTLTSITSHRSLDFDTAGDGDASPVQLAERWVQDRQDQFSQEIQLGGLARDARLNWLVGGLYFDESPREHNRVVLLGDLFGALESLPGPTVSPPGAPAFLCDPGPPPPGVPCFGGAGNPFNLAFFAGDGVEQFLDLDTTSWALFAEGSYDLTPKLSATVGLRYSHDDKEFSYVSVNVFDVVDSDLFNQGDWDAWTPRLSLAYELGQDRLLYASASRGFKSGGFNGRPQQRQVLDPFDPETVWTYELGLKSDWLNRRLRLNTAGFYSDYNDIQFAASIDVAGIPVFVTQNAGTARIWGFEVELVTRPATGLEYTLGVGHTRNELTELDPRVPAGLQEGGVLPKTPKWTVTSALQYALSLGGRGTLIARGDYSYRTEFFNDIANSPTIVQEAYGLVNARFLYAPPKDRWDLALFVTNLTDEEYLETGFFTGAFGPSVGIAGRPREWGLTAQVRF